LVRLASTPFEIENSNTLEEIKSAATENRIDSLIHSVEILFKHYKAVTIKATALDSIMNGNPLFEQGVQKGFEQITENENISIYSEEGFLGIGTVLYDTIKERLYIKVKNIFV
jgi:tRNA U55 pseudouridine synthase TruB